MTGQYYKVSNQTGEPALFHHQCYSCSHCKVPLDNSVVTVYHENHLYCMTDFNQLFPDISNFFNFFFFFLPLILFSIFLLFH